MGKQYDDDFYTWTKAQGKIIREKRFDEIDTENVAEEIERWGHRFKNNLADLVTLLQTCLLLCWAGQSTTFAMHTREIVRDHVKDMLEDYPGLKGELPTILADDWPRAVKFAAHQTRLTCAEFPQTCPWNIPELLLEYWYPEHVTRRHVMDEGQRNALFSEIQIRYAYQFRKPLQRDDMFSIDPGWLHIYADLFAAVDTALSEDEKPYFSWIPLRERLGGMRASFGVDRKACGEATAEEIRAKVRPLVEAAEAIALRICHICGHPGELRRVPYLETLCGAHARELDYE